MLAVLSAFSCVALNERKSEDSKALTWSDAKLAICGADNCDHCAVVNATTWSVVNEATLLVDKPCNCDALIARN